MKSRQVGAVLAALIVIGILALVLRLVSASSDEQTLAGLPPVSPKLIDQVIIRSTDKEAKLVKFGNTWRVGTHLVWQPKLNQLFSTVSEFNGARLIAANRATYARMGIDDQSAIEVLFFLGGSLQQSFLVSRKWSPNVRLCYLRRAQKDEVYAVPCPSASLFDPTVDGWRDPVVLAAPRGLIESFRFRVQGHDFVVRMTGTAPAVISEDVMAPADSQQLEILLKSVEGLLALGFVPEDEAAGLDFDRPDAILRVITREGSLVPTQRLLFLKRDDGNYDVKNTARPSIYIVDGRFVDSFMVPKEVYVTGPQQTQPS